MVKKVTVSWPPRIEFGAGTIDTLEKHLEGCKRVFILCDPNVHHDLNRVFARLESNDMKTRISTESVPEPPFETLRQILEPVRDFSPDALVGIGGGSTLDLAKLLAVLFRGNQTIDEILGIGNVEERRVRLIAASTTSGTGSEVTPNAILTDQHEKLKKGVVSPYLIPDVAIIDPELTLSVPPHVTASTGMDAMTHCIEAYTNVHAHPIIDTIAIEGIRLIGANIETAVTDGKNIAARESMSLGSLYGGMCLGPVNTAAVHALAYPLGGAFKVPHGVANSLLLPYVMSFNLPACTEKYARIAEALGEPISKDPERTAKQAVIRIKEISDACGIPAGLSELGIPESAVPALAEAAMKVTRLLVNNPRPLTAEDASQIYLNAFKLKIL